MEFLRGAGFKVEGAALTEPTFLPGVEIRYGGLVVDEILLLYPGDLLHEAGHIAVCDPAQRDAPRFSSQDGGEEMAAIAWSHAAARAIGLETSVVFHSGGYRGGGPSLAENFDAGRWIGHPLLRCWGMTLDAGEAADRGLEPYPHMLRWMR